MNIVRDERIRKEKYVFELLEGTNVSEIHNINHTKLNNQLKKKNKLNSVVQNHSTVTAFAKFLGWSTWQPLITAMWYEINCKGIVVRIGLKRSSTSGTSII